MGKIKDTLKKVFNRKVESKTPPQQQLEISEEIKLKLEDVTEKNQAEMVAAKVCKEIPGDSKKYNDISTYAALLIIKLANGKYNEIPETNQNTKSSFPELIQDSIISVGSEMREEFEAATRALKEKPDLAQKIPEAAYKTLTGQDEQYRPDDDVERVSKELGENIAKQLINNADVEKEWLPEEKDNVERLATLKLNAERSTASDETKKKYKKTIDAITSQLSLQSDSTLKQIDDRVTNLNNGYVGKPESEREPSLEQEGTSILLNVVQQALRSKDKTYRESDVSETSRASSITLQGYVQNNPKSRSYTQSEIQRAEERTDIGTGRS